MSYVQTFLLNLIILFLAPVWLFAGPVLMCDPYPVTELQPTEFVVVFDGGADRHVVPQQYPDGSSRLWYDLGEIADGIHTVKAKAVNSAINSTSPLESAWVAISFRKTGSQIVRIKDESEKLPPTRTFKGYLRDER
jgi:hypothetical protein